MTKLNVGDLNRFFLGFDRIDSELLGNVHQQLGTYPRYNIVKVGTEGYRVEVAVPGWDIKDIEITLDKNILKVEGKHKQTQDISETYIYKGLSGKSFERTFRVGENIQVDGAYMKNGLLCIDLHEQIPESLKPRKITIKNYET